MSSKNRLERLGLGQTPPDKLVQELERKHRELDDQIRADRAKWAAANPERAKRRQG